MEYHTTTKKNGVWLATTTRVNPTDRMISRQTFTRIYHVRLHWHELEKQVKPISSDRSQERGYLWEGILARRGTESLLGDGSFVYLDLGGDYVGINVFKNSSSRILKICALCVCDIYCRERKEERREGLLPFPLSLPLFFPSFPGREGEEGKGGERAGDGRGRTKPSQASKEQEGLWERVPERVNSLSTVEMDAGSGPDRPGCDSKHSPNRYGTMGNTTSLHLDSFTYKWDYNSICWEELC